MSKLFKLLGFILSWFAPFGVVYFNHVVTVDGYDVDMFGLLLILALVIGFMKYIDGRVEKWDIRNEHKVFRINWSNGKKILLVLGLTWVLFTIEDSLPKLQLSAILISISFVLGWFFTLLGNLRRQNKKD